MAPFADVEGFGAVDGGVCLPDVFEGVGAADLPKVIEPGLGIHLWVFGSHNRDLSVSLAVKHAAPTLCVTGVDFFVEPATPVEDDFALGFTFVLGCVELAGLFVGVGVGLVITVGFVPV